MIDIQLSTLKREIESLKNKANRFIESAEKIDRESTINHYEGYIHALEELESVIVSIVKYR